MSAGNGLQSDVLWGQDSGASSNCLLLAAALVPGYPGPGTGGNSVHHHHLHPEVMGAVSQNETCCFPWFMLTHAELMLMDVWIGVCSGSALWWWWWWWWGGGRGSSGEGCTTYYSVVMVA